MFNSPTHFLIVDYYLTHKSYPDIVHLKNRFLPFMRATIMVEVRKDDDGKEMGGLISR